MTPLRMTPGRRLALAIGVPLALIAIGWTALSGVAWAGRGSFPVSLDLPASGRPVSVSVDAGQVSVRPESGGPVRVRGTAHYALIRSTVSSQATAEGLDVRSHCRAVVGPCWFDYQVAVPTGQPAVLSDLAGPLSARGMSGDVTLHALAGTVHASQMSGRVTIRADAGDVVGAGLSGPQTTIDVAAGDVAVDGLAARTVTVTDLAGDVTLTFSQAPSRVLVTCGAGDVRLVLPPGRAVYRVIARAALGRARVLVPTSRSAPHLISVTDVAGNVTVTR